MQLCRHVDAGETDAVAETEGQHSGVGLNPCAEVEVLQSHIIQASAQGDAFMVGVFLHLTLPDEVSRELIGQAETEYNGQLFLVERLL